MTVTQVVGTPVNLGPCGCCGGDGGCPCSTAWLDALWAGTVTLYLTASIPCMGVSGSFPLVPVSRDTSGCTRTVYLRAEGLTTDCGEFEESYEVVLTNASSSYGVPLSLSGAIPSGSGAGAAGMSHLSSSWGAGCTGTLSFSGEYFFNFADGCCAGSGPYGSVIGSWTITE